MRVNGAGPTPARVMMVGEGPGKIEDRTGVPFHPHAPAGKELMRYMASANLTRDEVFITNLVKYRVKGDKDPSRSDIERDEEDLLIELAEADPKVLVTIGRASTRYFLGDVDMESVHGMPHLSEYGVVFPVFHPAAGLHSPEVQPLIQYDFECLGRLVKLPDDHLADVAINDDICEGEEWYREVSGESWDQEKAAVRESSWIALDTEGVAGKAWGLSLSVQAGRALVARRQTADGAFQLPLSLVREVARGKRVVLHNSLHDLTILRELGIDLSDSQYNDTMVMAYLLCLEPQGLKQLAYRHCGMRMRDYSGVVGPHANLVRARYLEQYLERCAKGLERCAKGEVFGWPATTANGKTKKPWSPQKRVARILKDYNADATTDVGARWKGLDDWITKAVETVAGEEWPEPGIECVPVDEAIHYSARDADATARLYPALKQAVEDAGMTSTYEIDMAVIPMVDRMMQVGVAVDRHYMEQLGGRLESELAVLGAEIEDLAGRAVNPASSDQVAKLLFADIGLSPKRKTRGGKDSTDDKMLAALESESGHPVVVKIMEYRETQKLKGTYVDKLPQWLGGDGRVHAKFRITRVPSGRLACSEPNLMAIPVRSELGKLVRTGFVAAPGKVFVSVDLDQIEMRILAHESGDENLIGVFERGEDIHRMTASRIWDVGVDEVTDDQRTSAKNIGFGIVYGITAPGLMAQMASRGRLVDEGECQDMIDGYVKRAYPGVGRLMDRCRAEARRYGWVADMFGRRRYLPGVHSRISRVRAEAERIALNHKIQAGAQGVMKIGMARVWRNVLPLVAGAEVVLQVHDDLMIEVGAEDAEAVEVMVKAEFEEAGREAGLGVAVTSKAKRGERWGEMKATGD